MFICIFLCLGLNQVSHMKVSTVRLPVVIFLFTFATVRALMLFVWCQKEHPYL